MEIRFDTYYTYAQLTERLAWLAEQHPDIMQLSALGKSHEGREIPLVILTNTATGPDTEKPAFWIDANIHATELTASMAALYFIKKMVEGYGSDPKITRILDEQAVYVVPRLNPDGAELALAEKPQFIRSGTRPYPYEEKRDGLHEEDLDGDGRILQMRIADPTGDWKVSEDDPRLMLKRGLDEEGGTYYRLFAEGLIENYDGHMIVPAPPLQGLDFNRNFPGAWRPEGEQHGAGDFPGSEPEIRAVVEFMAKHPNVFGALTYHTFSRAILRPYGTKADDQMETDDLWVFEAIGERGTALTGYPCVSVYHHFRYHPKEVITGVFDDWLFDHKGIFAFTVELWDLAIAAGVEAKSKDKKFMDWFRKHPVEDDVQDRGLRRPGRAGRAGALVRVRPSAARQGGAGRLGLPLYLAQPAPRAARGRDRAPGRFRAGVRGAGPAPRLARGEADAGGRGRLSPAGGGGKSRASCPPTARARRRR